MFYACSEKKILLYMNISSYSSNKKLKIKKKLSIKRIQKLSKVIIISKISCLV